MTEHDRFKGGDGLVGIFEDIVPVAVRGGGGASLSIQCFFVLFLFSVFVRFACEGFM